jgi:acyl-CoA oxidase
LTGETLKGLEIGDIGPKLGFKGVDNGYMKFTDFELPINALLARYITVDENGNVTDKSTKDS